MTHAVWHACDGAGLHGKQRRRKSPPFNAALCRQAECTLPKVAADPQATVDKRGCPTSLVPQKKPGSWGFYEFYGASSPILQSGETLQQVTSPGRVSHTPTRRQGCRWVQQAARNGGKKTKYRKPAQVTKEMTSYTIRGGQPPQRTKEWGTRGDPRISEPSWSRKQSCQKTVGQREVQRR